MNERYAILKKKYEGYYYQQKKWKKCHKCSNGTYYKIQLIEVGKIRVPVGKLKFKSPTFFQ